MDAGVFEVACVGWCGMTYFLVSHVAHSARWFASHTHTHTHSMTGRLVGPKGKSFLGALT